MESRRPANISRQRRWNLHVGQRALSVNRRATEHANHLVCGDTDKDVALRKDRRFHSDAPTVQIVVARYGGVQVVVYMHLPEPYARRALTYVAEQIVVQRHVQLARINRGVIGRTDEHDLVMILEAVP